MHYLIVSFTHKNSTLEIREKLAFVDEAQKLHSLQTLYDDKHINEIFIISTCNRVEVITSTSDSEDSIDKILQTLSKHAQISVRDLEQRADIFEDSSAIHHLNLVASSFDSMIVGESQITGQLKEAFYLSKEHGFAFSKLQWAMDNALKCAAEVRNFTDISSKPVSIASVAINRAKSLIPAFETKKALIIGSGEMSRICAKTLSAYGLSCTIINRTRDKAEAIAQEFGIEVDDYENLDALINLYDVIFTATGSIKPIITNANTYHCSFTRHWFDMAIPRDIQIDSIDDIELFVVDDLKSIVDENISLREEEAKKSYHIIKKYTSLFFDNLKKNQVEPYIKEIYAMAQKASRAESERVIKAKYIGAEHAEVIQKSNEQAIKRFLHPIVEQLRSESSKENSNELITVLSRVLKIDEDELEKNIIKEQR